MATVIALTLARHQARIGRIAKVRRRSPVGRYDFLAFNGTMIVLAGTMYVSDN